MGLVRTTVFTGLLGTSTAAAYLAARNPVISPLAAADPVWTSSVYKKQNPARNPVTQDICIKRVPVSKIRPELLKKDGDLALEFCRGVWGGWGASLSRSTSLCIFFSSFFFVSSLLTGLSNPTGYAIQRKYLEYKYRGPETASQLWDTEELSTSTYDKGTLITDHFEVLEKTPTSITVRAGDTPRTRGPRPSDGLFVISATVDKANEQVELSVKSVFFSSEGKIAGNKGPMPPWIEELHQWYSRVLNETASWKLLK